MSSWPFLFAAALAMWLLLKGPAAKTPLFVQKVCRIAIVFLRILRVPVSIEMGPILEMDAVIGIREPKQGRRLSDPDHRRLVWLIATLRILLRGFRISALACSVALESPVPRRETTRQGLTLTDWTLFYFSFHRK